MFAIPKTRLGAPRVFQWTSKQRNICSSANSHCMHQKLQAVNTSLVPRNSFAKNVLTWRKASRNCQWFSVKYFSSCGSGESKNKQNRRGRSTVCRLSVSDHLPRPSPPWRVLFFGTDNFSLKMLKTLNENRLQNGSDRLVDSLEVVATNRTDLEVPVRQYAREQGLRVLDWQPTLHPLDYDVGVLASFGFLIPSKVIDMFPYGILNVHPSLLPRWRGASPIEHTILYGDTVTGISIMEIRPKHFDIGPILLQKQYPVPDRVTALDLKTMMAERGSEVMMEALSNLPELERRVIEQSAVGVTYAHKLSRHTLYVDWESQSYSSIDRQGRALQEIEELRTVFNNTKINLLDPCDFHVLNSDPNLEKSVLWKYGRPSVEVTPGSLFYSKPLKHLLVKCQDGWTGFGTVRIKKKLKAVDFHCGYLHENPDPQFKRVDNGIKFNLDLVSPRPLHSETIPVDVREGWFTDLKVGHGG